jgi:hypothetical protein
VLYDAALLEANAITKRLGEAGYQARVGSSMSG